MSNVGGTTRRARPCQRTRRPTLTLGSIAILSIVMGISTINVAQAPQVVAGAGAAVTGIHKIKHVVVIMQENRSFDEYFGVYPGADGIPMSNGVPTVCNPDPNRGTCIKPYVDHHDVTQGGPHGGASAVSDIHNGLMDGFVSTAEASKSSCNQFTNPDCESGPINTTDVMGYRIRSDIPNYWKYADNFVLQDHMYEQAATWSLPSHMFEISGWSAKCTQHNVPSSCTNLLNQPFFGNPSSTSIYAWTDMTYLLHRNGISWGYYVVPGTEPDCANDASISCTPVPQSPTTPGIWNPLPYFDTVHNDGQLGNIQSVSTFYNLAKAGTLPAVSWVVPSGDISEHPPSTTSAGQSYVTSLINAVMRGPDWSSTAIFVSWDDWGGFYDHVIPPVVDVNGYGLRVPGLVISPYAKHGYIDHQTLSFDAFNKFIEDDFLSSQRLDPATDGRPDPRPDVRENVSILGDLTADFDFTQTPRASLLLPVHPSTTLIARPPFQPRNVAVTAGDGQATLTWQKPLTNGGSPITGYKIRPYIAGVAQPVRFFGASATSGTVTGLTNAESYTFGVAAYNQIGTGVWALSPPAVTIGAPLAPRAVKATAGQGSATVQWQAPSSDNGSGITGYVVTPHIGYYTTQSVSVGPTVTSTTFSGLPAGTSWFFTVTASNARGTGVSAKSNTVIPT